LLKLRLAKFRRFKTLLNVRAPRNFDGGTTDRTQTALPVASGPFAFGERGQICDLIDRPLLPTHAECTRTGEIFEIRESVGLLRAGVNDGQEAETPSQVGSKLWPVAAWQG
jgi:hypothetical protein